MSNYPLSIVQATWVATYRKVLAATGNEGDAIFEAERAVRRAHGSSATTQLYNINILVDHFNGKLSADDPAVHREFQLLRQQAEVDWIEMCSGKPTQATPENIADDYIANAKLTAKSQLVLKKLKLIAILAIVVVGILIYGLRK